MKYQIKIDERNKIYFSTTINQQFTVKISQIKKCVR